MTFESRLTAIEATLTVIQVLVGVNIALMIGVLWLACTITDRVPR